MIKTNKLLFILFTLFAIIPIIVITVVSSGIVIKLNNEKLDENYKYSLNHICTIFSLRLELLQNDITSMMENSELASVINDENVDNNVLDKVVSEYMGNYTDLKSIVFFTKTNDVIVWGQKPTISTEPISFILNTGKIYNNASKVTHFGFNDEIISGEQCFVSGAKIISDVDGTVLCTLYIVLDKNYFDIPNSNYIKTYIYNNELKTLYASENDKNISFYDFSPEIREYVLGNSFGTFDGWVDDEKYVFVHAKDENLKYYFVQTIQNDVYISEIPVVIKIILMSSLILFVIAILFSLLLSKKLISPITSLLFRMENNTLDAPSFVQVSKAYTYEINELYRIYNDMVRRLEISNAKSIEHEIQKSDMELKMLQQQINPHFLNNTLNALSIRLMIDGNREMAEMLKTLSRLLKNYTTYSATEISVITEIECLKDFMDIMLLRYKNKFKVSYNVADDVAHCRVIGVVLQPIAENAVYHGLSDKMTSDLQTDAEVKISAYKENDNLIFEVTDNGIGFDKDYASIISNSSIENVSSHIGLSNINSRIKLRYGTEYGLEIISEKNKFSTVRLKLPIVEPTKPLTENL